jgi:probable HAF family extracellular repeat protein
VFTVKVRSSLILIGAIAALTFPKLAQADGVTYTNFVTIDFTGAVDTIAGGINNAGQIVGGYINSDGSRHGFLLSGGQFTTIDFGNHTTELTGINNSGQIVGAYDLNSLSTGDHGLEGAHGFLTNTLGNSFTPIDYPGGVASTTPSKINDSGSVVGVYRSSLSDPGQGFLLTGGNSYSTVNVPFAAFGTHANGINNAGLIVGQYHGSEAGNPHHGYLQNGSAFTPIDVPGATETWATDINTAGNIVGFSSLNGGTGYFLAGSTFSPIAFPGALVTDVFGINDSGDVVGFYEDANQVIHGFEALPSTSAVPEPGSLSLLVVGLGALTTLLRRLWNE